MKSSFNIRNLSQTDFYKSNTIQPGFLSIKESIIRDNNKKSLKPYFTFWRNYTNKEESSDSSSDSESDDESLTINEHIEKYFIEYIMAIGVALICWLKYKEKSYC